jgi:hypothetical protein
MGRFVLIANDAERVQISTQYSCVIVAFILTSIAVSQLLNSLAQTLFPIKPKPPRTRFFGNGSLQFLPCAIGKTTVTISVSFALL